MDPSTEPLTCAAPCAPLVWAPRPVVAGRPVRALRAAGAALAGWLGWPLCLVLLLAWAAGGSRAQTVVHDDRGAAVRLAGPPQRIV